jgi:hypothetical protein
MKYSSLAVCVAAILCGCSSKENVKLSGLFIGTNNDKVILEQVTTAGRIFVDSTRTTKKGEFKFKFSNQSNTPEFYNIISNNQYIPLIVSAGEKIKIRAAGNISANYEISGSPDSERVKKLNSLVANSLHKFDSIREIYNSISDEKQKEQTRKDFSKIGINLKRDYINFIIDNSNSMSSLYALYQIMPDGQVLLNDQGDFVYYRLVADSLTKIYPDAPHVKRLLKDLDKIESSFKLSNMVAKSTLNKGNYPELELPDMYGNKIRLSSVNMGKVVLLDFWVTVDNTAQMRNLELKNIYKKYKDKGLEIYQVALDQNKSAWITTVQETKLPWISVCDFKGIYSPAARLYNISKVPANYLINEKGEIIGKNMTTEELEKKFASIFK